MIYTKVITLTDKQHLAVKAWMETNHPEAIGEKFGCVGDVRKVNGVPSLVLVDFSASEFSKICALMVRLERARRRNNSNKVRPS